METIDNDTKDNDTIDQNNKYMSKKRLVCLIIVIILLFFSFTFGIFIGRVAPRMNSHRFSNRMGGGFSYSFSQPLSSSQTEYLSNGPMGMNQSTNTIEIQGVITAINGQTITIAGNGSTNNITINSSTQYTNGSSLKVNDTILVNAQFSSNQLTAQSVTLNP